MWRPTGNRDGYLRPRTMARRAHCMTVSARIAGSAQRRQHRQRTYTTSRTRNSTLTYTQQHAHCKRASVNNAFRLLLLAINSYNCLSGSFSNPASETFKSLAGFYLDTLVCCMEVFIRENLLLQKVNPLKTLPPPLPPPIAPAGGEGDQPGPLPQGRGRSHQRGRLALFGATKSRRGVGLAARRRRGLPVRTRGRGDNAVLFGTRPSLLLNAICSNPQLDS